MLDKALDFAERDVTVKERYNLLDTLPYAYYQLGHILVDLGRYDLAEKNYCKSIAMAEKVGGETFFKILSKMLLARCYIKRKNIFKARAISKEAIQEAIREGGYIEAICCMLIGISFIQMNKLDEGERYLTRGRYLIEKARPRYFLTMLYGALAYLSMLKKDKPDLEKYGTQYFNLAVENNYIQMSVALYKLFRPVISRLPESSFTFEKRSFINELDERCKKTNFFARVTTSEKSSAEKSFEKLSCMLSESKKYPFVVNMFGLFELYHHDRRLVIKGLFSKKAMELLILLIHRGHQLTKDEIIDTLWPDTVSKNIHNVFHATLYNLRSGLKKIAPNIEHIIYECGVYRLEENVFFSTHTYYCNDLINILNDKNIGDKEISVIVDILKYYNREYLYNMDREWLEISRAFYETIFEKAVIKLSEQYIALGKYDEAVKYLYRLLELNPYMDETYYLLIKAKIESKQYHVARRIYENYVAVIRNEMNSEPIDKITKLFT
jgi:two-component SAPR family response regulator